MAFVGVTAFNLPAKVKRDQGKAATMPTERSEPIQHRRNGRCFIAVVLAFVSVGWLSSCTTVGPDYKPPATEMPDVWNINLSRGLKEGNADLRTWWTNFNDPILDGLIQRATQGNLDTKQAVARILEARANIGIASGEALPSVDAFGEVDTNRISDNVQEDVGNGRQRTSTLYSSGLSAEWELDVWGRIARSIESADAGLQFTVEDYRDVLVSLYSDVALNYIGVRTAQARIQAALDNVETQKKTLELVEDRRRAELASDLEVAQAKLNLAITESNVPLRRQELANSVHALGVLIGERPTILWPELTKSKPIPQPPKEIVVGLPTELLRQRPDVRAAERSLAQQTAQIGVATADLYPRFSLTGFFAFESFGFNDWAKWESRALGIGPTVQWNVFDGGRIRSQIQVEDAQTQEALFVYEETVLDALREVEDSMVNYVQENERRDKLLNSVNAAADSVRLVTTLYVTGLTDFQNVQDQERTKAAQDDQYFESQGRVAGFLVDIYRSLGGGWGPQGASTTTTKAPDPATAKAKTASAPPPKPKVSTPTMSPAATGAPTS